MKYCVAGVMALASGLVLAADTRTTIPKQFLGEWGADRKSCLHLPNDPDTDTLTMRVEPSKISFYESVAKVLAVATSGELELALILEISEDGGTSLATREFELSADMNTITDVTGYRKGSMRVRCQRAARK